MEAGASRFHSPVTQNDNLDESMLFDNKTRIGPKRGQKRT